MKTAIEIYAEMRDERDNLNEISNSHAQRNETEKAIEFNIKAQQMLEKMNRFYLENQEEIDNNYDKL